MWIQHQIVHLLCFLATSEVQFSLPSSSSALGVCHYAYSYVIIKKWQLKWNFHFNINSCINRNTEWGLRIEDTVQGLCVWVLHTSVCKGCQIHRHLVLVKKGLGVWRECLFHMKKHQSLPFWVWSEPPCFDSDLKSIPWHIGVSLLMTTFPKNLQWVFWGRKWWFLMKLAKRNISNRFREPTYPENTEEIELKNWTLNINDFYRSKWICNWEGFLALINTKIVKIRKNTWAKSRYATSKSKFDVWYYS